MGKVHVHIHKVKDADVSNTSMSAGDIQEAYGPTFLARVMRQKEATAPDGKVVKVDGRRFIVFDSNSKDADPESEFKAKVADINRILTDASRKAELLSSVGAPELKAKAAKLETLIDAARRYAFEIR